MRETIVPQLSGLNQRNRRLAEKASLTGFQSNGYGRQQPADGLGGVRSPAHPGWIADASQSFAAGGTGAGSPKWPDLQTRP